MAQQVEEAKYRAELREMYSRFGWEWVVLAYVAGRMVTRGKKLPNSFLSDLTLARSKMESGCCPVCDVLADLRALENTLFPTVLEAGEGEVHAMQELIGKAMDGTIEQREVDLSPFKVVLADCSIPTVCGACSPYA
jgi:hypothetical protein